MRVLSAAQMREADRRTIEERGVPSIELMDRAGRAVAACVMREFPDAARSGVAILCGRGNNGGDGFVAARVLAAGGVPVSVTLIGRAADVSGDAADALRKARDASVDVTEAADVDAWGAQRIHLQASGVVIDALLGTGLKSTVSGVMEMVVRDVNASGLPVVSVDLPSGLSADDVAPIGPSIQAARTVTLGALKLPLIMGSSETFAGAVEVADIGIPRDVIEGIDGPRVEIITAASVAGHLGHRRADAHKGDFGRVLIVAGSLGKTGAAGLSALSALRSGAGLVTVATPKSCAGIVAGLGLEFMTEALPETAIGGLLEDAADTVLALDADVIAVGPGLGQAASTAAFVQRLVQRSKKPLVLDADALNAFQADSAKLRSSGDVPIVITPHPGEMARLCGRTTSAVQDHRLEVAVDFARDHRIVVVLKGHRTIVASPDGRAFVNRTGNPGMATGGTGDVLTGMIAAWMGQLRDALEAARVSVYLHGRAGDLAAADVGEVSLIAGDLIDQIGPAIRATVADRNRDAW